MAFFNILETFFFISLAITFVLIMMLVYHFKGRIILLEQKCDTMFEIMNSIVKEMRNISMNTNNNINQFRPEMMVPSNESMIPNLGEIFKQMNNNVQYVVNDIDDTNNIDESDHEEDDEEDDDIDIDIDIDDELPYEKIIVSDTENDEIPVKIINIVFDNNNNTNNESNASINDLEEIIENDESDDEVEDENNEEYNNEGSINKNLDNEKDESIIVNKIDDSITNTDYLVKNDVVDYKKVDIIYLRTLVITRGLASDTKKLKKNDLIKLLEQSEE